MNIEILSAYGSEGAEYWQRAKFGREKLKVAGPYTVIRKPLTEARIRGMKFTQAWLLAFKTLNPLVTARNLSAGIQSIGLCLRGIEEGKAEDGKRDGKKFYFGSRHCKPEYGT